MVKFVPKENVDLLVTILFDILLFKITPKAQQLKTILQQSSVINAPNFYIVLFTTTKICAR